jgi:lysophospholipase L1-like esterase
VEGTLTQTNSTGGYTFARKASGTAVSVERPALLETWGYRNQRNDVTVIWVGTNDTSSWMSITWTMENIQRMIETLSHDKYIILGLTSKHQFSDIVSRNNAMFRKFGRHFLDVRQYLLDYGLSDNNLTPTEQDLADIADGEIPSSLRIDNVHFNNSGYQSVAKCVYIRGKELSYWN